MHREIIGKNEQLAVLINNETTSPKLFPFPCCAALEAKETQEHMQWQPWKSEPFCYSFKILNSVSCRIALNSIPLSIPVSLPLEYSRVYA